MPRANPEFFSHPDFNRRLWNFTKSTESLTLGLGFGSRAIPPAQIFTDPEERFVAFAILTENQTRGEFISPLSQLFPRNKADFVVNLGQSGLCELIGPIGTGCQQAIQFGRIGQ